MRKIFPFRLSCPPEMMMLWRSRRALTSRLESSPWGLFMAVTTITTVGYREVHPLDTSGRLFTMAYLLGGVGPGVVGLRGGVLGQAVVAPGALVHLGGRVWLDLAFRFSLSFPGGKCRRAFPAQEAPGFCELQFGPQLGLVAAF